MGTRQAVISFLITLGTNCIKYLTCKRFVNFHFSIHATPPTALLHHYLSLCPVCIVQDLGRKRVAEFINEIWQFRKSISFSLTRSCVWQQGAVALYRLMFE